jgi:hypothetical protein
MHLLSLFGFGPYAKIPVDRHQVNQVLHRPYVEPPPNPRIYLVPEGLRDRVLELMDNAEKEGMRHTAVRELWRLITDRCPETKQGRWRISHLGAELVVEERLGPHDGVPCGH